MSIEQCEARRWAALRSNDTTTLAELFDDDLAYTHSNGLVDTKTDFLERLDSGRMRYLGIAVSDQTLRVFGDTAVASGHAVLTTEAGGSQRETHLRYTAVWVRDETIADLGWRHVAWHSSSADV